MSQVLEPLVTAPLRVAAAPGRGERAALRAGRGASWWTLLAIGAVAAVGLMAVSGTVLLNGDGVWHLIWGRELANGTLESFSTGPTPHPSLLALGAVTSLLGDDASYRVSYVLFGPLAFGALVASVYDVARRLSSPWAAGFAVLILVTSPGVFSLASSARYDLAFAALVMTAIALELARPRRAVAPLVCLAVAGLIRPEAWVLAGVYWLYSARRQSWPARLRAAALVVAALVVWMAMDLAVTGDPLYSLHITDEYSVVLYGQYTAWENLEVGGRNLVWYLGIVPLLLLAPAAVLLVRDRPRGAPVVVGALALTVGIFVALVAQGMASNARYLLVPVCLLAILAALAVDGGGRRTRARVVTGAFAAAILGLSLTTRLDVYEPLSQRVANTRALERNAGALVSLPGVRAALQDCRAVSLAAGQLRPWFAFSSGRAPERFVGDGKGLTRPDLYIAPGNATVARRALTRDRFDTDASFRVPPGLQAGPRNADWVLYVDPASACARGLL